MTLCRKPRRKICKTWPDAPDRRPEATRPLGPCAGPACPGSPLAPWPSPPRPRAYASGQRSSAPAPARPSPCAPCGPDATELDARGQRSRDRPADTAAAAARGPPSAASNNFPVPLCRSPIRAPRGCLVSHLDDKCRSRLQSGLPVSSAQPLACPGLMLQRSLGLWGFVSKCFLRPMGGRSVSGIGARTNRRGGRGGPGLAGGRICGRGTARGQRVMGHAPGSWSAPRLIKAEQVLCPRLPQEMKTRCHSIKHTHEGATESRRTRALMLAAGRLAAGGTIGRRSSGGRGCRRRARRTI